VPLPTSWQELTQRQAKALADAHVNHFSNLLRRAKEGLPGIREKECEMYLGIWQEAQRLITNEDWKERLGPAAKRELNDAIESGDYDKLLSSTGPS
jgi:hypothetical protein